MYSHYVSGLGTAMVHPPITATLGEYFNKRRGFAMSIALSGASFGGLVFAPIMSALFDSYGYTGTVLIVAGMTLNICVAGCLMRPMKSFIKARAKVNSCGCENAQNSKYKEIEMHSLVNGDTKKPLMNSTDEIITQLVLEQENHKVKCLPSRALLQIKESDARLERSSSVKSDKPSTEQKCLESPLLPRARAWSTGNKRQRTVSAISEKSHPSPMLSPLNSLVDSLSHSTVAIFSSAADGIYGSVLDIQEITIREVTQCAGKDEQVISKPSVCEKLRSSFDFSIFKNPIFIMLLFKAALLACASILMPSFLAPHAKDQGLTIEERGWMMTTIGGFGMIARLSLALLADRNLFKLTTLLFVMANVIGITAHLIRFVQGYPAFIVLAAITGYYT